MSSIYYSFYFFIGFILFKNKRVLTLFLSSVYIPLFLSMYASAFFISNSFINNIVIRDLLTGVGACGFICIALENKIIRKILSISIINFYGKISYSFYLFHLPIMYLVLYTINGDLLFCKVLIFLLTSFVAYINYLLIEERFIKVGKVLFN